ncbi:MAG: cytochrome b [Gammaproteobacteria bacterium]
MLRNSNHHYGYIAQLLHWTVALLIIGLIPMGWWMVGLDYYHGWYHRAPQLHKVLGMVALLLAAVRIGWAIIDRPPPLVASLHPWERIAASGAHHLLYLATLAIPVTGYLISTSRGEGIDFYGWFEVPALLPEEKGREEWAGALHAYLAYGTAALVCAHAFAALKHQFIDRNGTLRRMLGRPADQPPTVSK